MVSPELQNCRRIVARLAAQITKGYWIDNIVLPIHLSLGSLDDQTELTILAGQRQDLRQCEEYTSTTG